MADDPLFIAASAGAPAFAANELRRAFAALLFKGVTDRFGARQGVHPAGANAVSISGMTVTVQHLNGVVYPGLTSLAGPYLVALQTGTHAVPAADATNPRKDIVCLQVQDHDEDASGFRRAQSVYVQGTPAGSPVEPAVPTGAFRMATVDLPAGSTTPTLTYNAPFTVAAGGILPVRNDAELLGTVGGLYDGAARWNRDLDALEVHNGVSAWETVARANVPRVASGELAVTPDTVVTTNFVGGGQTLYRGALVVTFPAGRFTAIPHVVLSAETGVPGTVIEAGPSLISTTGFTASVARMNQTATDLHWIAMQP